VGPQENNPRAGEPAARKLPRCSSSSSNAAGRGLGTRTNARTIVCDAREFGRDWISPHSGGYTRGHCECPIDRSIDRMTKNHSGASHVGSSSPRPLVAAHGGHSSARRFQSNGGASVTGYTGERASWRGGGGILKCRHWITEATRERGGQRTREPPRQIGGGIGLGSNRILCKQEVAD